jgi:hypothetical protein
VLNTLSSTQQPLDLPDTGEVANNGGDDGVVSMISSAFWNKYKSFVALVAAAKNSGIDKSVLEQHCPYDCPYSLNDKWSQLETSPLPAYSRQTLDWMATSSLPKENDRWRLLFELYHYKVVNGPMYIYAPSSRKQSMK